MLWSGFRGMLWLQLVVGRINPTVVLFLLRGRQHAMLQHARVFDMSRTCGHESWVAV